jgi:hypothetical protein
MATINGIDGALKAVTTGGTQAVVSELKGWSVEETADTVETTVMGATTKSFAATLKSWSGTCELNYEPGNAVQIDLLIGESVDVEFYPKGVANSTKFTGTGIVTSHSRSGSMADLVGSSVSLQGTGALVVVA